MSTLIDLVPKKVTSEMNEILEKEFTEEEIHDALFQMDPSKSLGIDGFIVGFFSETLDLGKI
uniref:Uncharacterized protein n=1 Tax=Arundo donax TaxID=35708 RepID=A0A0A9AL10_ARUDO